MKFLMRLLINLGLFLLLWQIKPWFLRDFPMGLDQSPLRQAIQLIIGLLLIWLGKYLLEKIYQHSREFRQHPWQSCKQLVKENKVWLAKKFNEKAILEALEKSKFLAYLDRPWLKYFLIPSLLLLFALGWSAYVGISSDSALSLLSKKGDSSYFKNFSLGQEIRPNEVVSGQFQALENNLGMISIAFSNPSSLNQEKLIFRIKEMGQNEWLTINEYLSSQFHRSGQMYFGLPIQAESKDKTYDFELELRSEELIETESENLEEKIEILDEVEIGEPFALSAEEPVIRTHYKFGRDYLLNDKRHALSFAMAKIGEISQNWGFILNALIGFFPFLFYLFTLKYRTWLRREFNSFNDLIALWLIIYLCLEVLSQLIILTLKDKLTAYFNFEISVLLLFLFIFYTRKKINHV